jgi:hypothetical protein
MSTTQDYISSKEGESLLKVSRQMFFYYVNKGRIRKLESEKRRGTLYHRADIMQLRAELQKEDIVTNVSVDWMAISDLPAILALDIELYGEDEPLADITLYQAWWKKNPKTTVIAFESSNRGRILAQCCILPLPESIIFEVLSEKRNETEIKPEHVETYEREGEYNLLVESIIARPNERENVGPIIRAFTDFWYEKWPKRWVRKIYARAVSKEGEYLVHKLYFSPLYEYGEKAYVLDLNHNNPSHIIRGFKDRIAAKKTEK